MILFLRLTIMVSGVVLSVGGYFAKIDLFNERFPAEDEIYRSSPDFTSKTGNWSEFWILADDLTLLRGNKITISVYADSNHYWTGGSNSFNTGLTIYFVEIAHPGEKTDEGAVLDIERFYYNFSGYLDNLPSPFWATQRETYFPYDKICRVYWLVDVSTTTDKGVIIQFDISMKITRSLDSSDIRPCVNTLILGLVLFSASFMLVHRRHISKDSDDTVLWGKEPK